MTGDRSTVPRRKPPVWKQQVGQCDATTCAVGCHTHLSWRLRGRVVDADRSDWSAGRGPDIPGSGSSTTRPSSRTSQVYVAETASIHQRVQTLDDVCWHFDCLDPASVHVHTGNRQRTRFPENGWPRRRHVVAGACRRRGPRPPTPRVPCAFPDRGTPSRRTTGMGAITMVLRRRQF